MPYTAAIERSNPTVFLFLIDQSGSMGEKMASERTKAQFVADAVNKILSTQITRCTKAEGTRDYFDIGVIGYSDTGPYNSLQGPLGGSILHKISEFEANPLRVEQRKQKMDDGAGGIVEMPVEFPIWFEPHANGGTPMRQAFVMAAEELAAWCDAHPDSYPPTILHLTDGESTDGDPEELAMKLREIATNDGQVLLFNLHVSTSGSQPIKFPKSEITLPDDYARMLFRMSSYFPTHLIDYASKKGYNIEQETRFYMFNAEAPEIVDFYDIGTKAVELK